MAFALLTAVPVGGAPNLQVGSTATYNVSVTVSFSPPICETTSTSTSTTVQPDVIACPLEFLSFPSIIVNGTIGWTTTSLNSTTTVLNVTRDLTTHFGNHTLTNTGSFSESIYANRTISLMPLIMPDMDHALQLAQSNMVAGVPGASTWASSMSTISSAMWIHPRVYTMWWVNGPLNLNETVPVFFFPTNVSSTSNIDLGSLGTRSAWNLTYSLPSHIEPDLATATAIPIGEGFHAALSFNYDQKSDLLISATADYNLGFLTPLPTGCTPSATSACPLGSDCFTIPSGISIEATITLAKTSLNLDQRLSSGGDPSTGTSSGSSPQPSPGASTNGSGPGPSTGATGSGTTGTNTGSGTSGTSSGNGNSGTNGASSVASGTSPGTQQTSPRPSTTFAWIYVLIAIVGLVIILGGTYYARQRLRKSTSPAIAPQLSS